jgi:hypothetical protein
MYISSIACLLLSASVVYSTDGPLSPCSIGQSQATGPITKCLPVVYGIDSGVTNVIAIAKEGIHNPGTFFAPPPSTWGLEGASQISEPGKQQAFAFGQSLRNFVGTTFLNPNYMPGQFIGYCGASSYTQDSLLLIEAALFPPSSFATWNPALPWSPVPININNALLEQTASNCPNYTIAYQPINDEVLPVLAALYNAKKPLIDYIATNTGWNSSIASAQNAALNVRLIQLYNAAYPSWIENPTLPGYTKDSLIADILSFYYVKSIACSNYAPCRSSLASSLLASITGSVLQSASLPQLSVYITHTENMLSLAHLAHLRLDTLPDAGGFLIEVRNGTVPSLRFLFHEAFDPLTNFNQFFYQAEYLPELAAICDANGWCPADKYSALIANDVVSFCGAAPCSASR